MTSAHLVTTAALAAALLGSACSAAGPELAQRVEARQAFSLKAGASAQLGDSGWQLGFDGVANDSRCPKGAQCVWAGEAIVRLWLRQHGQAPQAFQLKSSPGLALASHIMKAQGQVLEVRLLQLEPHPTVVKPLAASDYVATLVFGPAAPSSPER